MVNPHPCHLVWVDAWSAFCVGTVEDPSLRFFATMYVKDQVLGNIFRGTLSDSFQQNLWLHSHCQDILRLTPTRYGIFCLLLAAVYCPCGLKLVYPTINLTFLGIIFKVKLPAKFCLNTFEWFFFLWISSDIKYFFLFCPRHYIWGLIVTRSLAWWVECSLMVRETGVQSQVKSYEVPSISFQTFL